TREDFTRSGESYDLMIDIAGNHSWSECKRVLAPTGIMVAAGGSAHTVWGYEQHDQASHRRTDVVPPWHAESRSLHREAQQGRPAGPAEATRGRKSNPSH